MTCFDFYYAVYKFVSVSCQQLDTIPSGNFTITSDGLFTAANYTCSEGYTLEGTAVLTCNTDGVWSSTPPKCSKLQSVVYIYVSLQPASNLFCSVHLFQLLVFMRFGLYFKGTPISKALTCTTIILNKQKMAILSRRLTLLAIILHEQCTHHKQINLRQNKQLLSTQQHAYQSFLSYFLL